MILVWACYPDTHEVSDPLSEIYSYSLYRLITVCWQTPNWNFTGLVISDISTSRGDMDCFHPAVMAK